MYLMIVQVLCNLNLHYLEAGFYLQYLIYHALETQLIKQLSFIDAIELAYYGAKVIHPKTIQPLKEKKIPLHVRSFKYVNKS